MSAAATYLLLTIGLLGGAALAFLAVLARRQHARASDAGLLSLGEPVADLVAEVEAVGVAAQHAQQEADEARRRVDSAERERERAESHYREVQFGPRSDDPRRLVERAALDAYGRGDLSEAQLDAIWQQLPGSTATEAPAEVLEDARQQYEQAAAEAVKERQQAYVAELAAEVLAEEERAVEDQLLQAQRSTSAGLPALFAAPPEDSGVVVDFRTAEYGVIPARRAS